MNARHLLMAACVFITPLLASPSPAADRPVELEPAQLGTLQSHRYAVDAKTAFNATLAALQTQGYSDIDADRESGTISATTEAKARTFYNFFWGFGKKKLTQKASLLVEDTGAGSLVRLNLTVYETKARGIFQTSFTDGKLVRVAPPYQDFFRFLDAEIASRGGGRTATIAAAAAAAAAGKPIDLGGGVQMIPAETKSGYCLQAPVNNVGTGSATRPVISLHLPRC